MSQWFPHLHTEGKLMPTRATMTQLVETLAKMTPVMARRRWNDRVARTFLLTGAQFGYELDFNARLATELRKADVAIWDD